MEQIMAYAQENAGSGSGASTFWYVVMAIGLWKMFEKAGEPGWIGFIPFYNQYKLCEKVMNNPWYWLRLFTVVIPFVGIILYLYFTFQIGKATAKAYGQSEAWAWGYTFLTPVFYCITGFSSQYSYYGPFGVGDTRTGDARQAKTVDFEVVEKQPVKEAAPAAARTTVPSESEVEFDFHDDDIME